MNRILSKKLVIIPKREVSLLRFFCTFFLFIFLTTTVLYLISYQKQEETIYDLLIQVEQTQENLLRARAAHDWVLLLEQILPNLTKMEIGALAESVKQQKQKSPKNKKSK